MLVITRRGESTRKPGATVEGEGGSSGETIQVGMAITWKGTNFKVWEKHICYICYITHHIYSIHIKDIIKDNKHPSFQGEIISVFLPVNCFKPASLF